MAHSEPAFETLDFAAADGVARVTLRRPEAANALTPLMCRELSEAATLCDERGDVRAAILEGAGGAFSAGGDLNLFASAGDGLGATIKTMTADLHAAVSRLSRMDAPVVCAVRGVAAGAGLGLAASCDYAMAADSARFTLAYTAVGLSPDGSSTWFLPRLVGLRRARELMLTNRTLSADEARDIGLVDAVVPEDRLEAEVLARARAFAAGPTRAYGAVKRLLQDSMTNGLETQMEREARTIADLSRGADVREGVAAFVGKRKPAFVGA